MILRDTTAGDTVRLCRDTLFGGTMYGRTLPAGTIARVCWITGGRAVFVEVQQESGWGVMVSLPGDAECEVISNRLAEIKKDTDTQAVADPLQGRNSGDLFSPPASAAPSGSRPPR